MAQYQIAVALNPKDKQVKGVQNAYNEVLANPFLVSFFSLYSEASCMGLARGCEGASVDRYFSWEPFQGLRSGGHPVAQASQR